MKPRKFRVLMDCFCEGYLHEITNYPRAGLVERKLLKDDVVTFQKEWFNLYGKYFRVEKDGVYYDIPPIKLIEVLE